MVGWSEPPQTALVAAKPHPWSGVSPDMFRLFSKAVTLCRRSRIHWWYRDGISYKVLQKSMKDIEKATVVEEALMCFERTDPAQLLVSNRDLDNLTEDYRLSSLLQLYESFPDLVTKWMTGCPDADGKTAWNTSVTPLALAVTNILQQLPVSSMRRIHLYSACLRAAGYGTKTSRQWLLGIRTASMSICPSDRVSPVGG
ncbi:hypothetical protein QBC36DRAFT_359110 [Triangularia setosa]|uniref:Uncharacterized protein n=1 Tax=Triangularia setosa TaxID=2587417 RepID=A0AAN6W1L2_9PEZI|nr:hypothetical protein QBC36DRAFT_359110 [Podospora setosa]